LSGGRERDHGERHERLRPEARRVRRASAHGALRLFVALYPDGATSKALFEALAHEELPPHRQTPREQLHLTAHFVGEVDERQLASVVESIAGAARAIAPFVLQPLHLATLPESGPARLVAAVTDLPSALLELHERLVARLARGRSKRETFLPHLTLARFTTPTRVAIDSALVHVPPISVTTVHLMQSRIGDGAVSHRGLAKFELGAD
jgi:RNA 2',3'-cyclic 3'-phosphodiesterase